MNGKKAKHLRKAAKQLKATMMHKVTGERIPVPVRTIYKELKK